MPSRGAASPCLDAVHRRHPCCAASPCGDAVHRRRPIVQRRRRGWLLGMLAVIDAAHVRCVSTPNRVQTSTPPSSSNQTANRLPACSTPRRRGAKLEVVTDAACCRAREARTVHAAAELTRLLIGAQPAELDGRRGCAVPRRRGERSAASRLASHAEARRLARDGRTREAPRLVRVSAAALRHGASVEPAAGFTDVSRSRRWPRPTASRLPQVRRARAREERKLRS